ncbi:tail protein X [Escherichia coli]|nr:tail protein X [Escherichia coli]
MEGDTVDSLCFRYYGTTQGVTVDSLCFRYYGTTQGVTEKVLDANPGLCQQVFLDAGQEVEMPEPEKKKREMIQLWGE